MTTKEIIDLARILPFGDRRWDILYAEAAFQNNAALTEYIARMERLAYRKEEIKADMY